ncbi:unnamed protein product [Spodoptera littoralis]|uniref:C-type lectin domain-containing protein n=1 Tax=Spodoptera littoralis TaxID=7109 RepID=A0A9P0NAI1_SPOLI|nr:unnamed protein product [Spodoptera littoralis]CAH1645773.1 unnamed protein product [Spodoptera littoralis]
MLKIYLICLLCLFVLNLEHAQCKPDYLFNANANGWLKVHTIPATWEEAFLRCHYEGAVLASPLTKEMGKALLEKTLRVDLDQTIHLGTHDLNSKGDYFSVEGVPLDSLVLSWSKVKGTGDCLAMTRDGLAMLTKCTEPRPYICYKKLDNLTMNICGTFDDAYQFNEKTGSCYKTHLQKKTWSDAFKMCAAEGGYLLILNDATEAAIVKEMFPKRTGKDTDYDRFHVGLQAWGPERTWITIHGERIENVFMNWHPGQPDNFQGVQDRGAFMRMGSFDDHAINAMAMFVCEKDPNVKRFEELPGQLAVSEQF